MIKFYQIIKIKHRRTTVLKKNPEAIVALGSIGNNIFTIKILDSKNIKVTSKKYLKKSDSKMINDVLIKGDYDNEDCIIENIDLTDLGYIEAMDEIEEKFKELNVVCRK